MNPYREIPEDPDFEFRQLHEYERRWHAACEVREHERAMRAMVHSIGRLIMVLVLAGIIPLLALGLTGCEIGDNVETGVDANPDQPYEVDCNTPPLTPTLIPTGATATGVTLSPADFARVLDYQQHMAAFLTTCTCAE